MDKVAIKVSADPSFFEEVAQEAARLDRSQSWLLAWCLRAALPRLAKTNAKPAGMLGTRRPTSRTVFLSKDLHDDAERIGAKLGMTDDDILAFAWQETKGTVKALPSS